MAYHSLEDLVRQTQQTGKTLPQLVLENETALSGQSEPDILAELCRRLSVMRASAQKALHAPQQMACGLISGQAMAQQRYLEQAGPAGTLCGATANLAMALALSCSEVNASMGRICAAPTAGSCGILPAVLGALEQAHAFTDAQLQQALLTASGVGAVIMKNATVAGAEGGCQAECGTAAAMAAAAAVQLFGGTAEQMANAAGIALVNVMGLVCDPVAGLVQLPCSFRNASGAVNALLSADLALAGLCPGIPPDEVVDAMYKTGRKLPMELRETALGGMAAQPAAKQVARRLAAGDI